MDFKGDVRFLLLLGAGVVAVGWAVTYAGAVHSLVSTGTNGYISMVNGLLPYQARGGITGGAGTIPQSVGMDSYGQPMQMAGYGG